MAVEIERRFFVKNDLWKEQVFQSVEIRQNYMASRPTVRVRLAGEKGFLTLKKWTAGFSKAEYEYEIPAEDARALLETFCNGYEISKVRHKIEFGGKVWELDVFSGWNTGLILAEVELTSEKEEIELPPWAGEEITGDSSLSNGALAKLPWKLRQAAKKKIDGEAKTPRP